MNTFDFIFGMCTLAAVCGLVVYLTRTFLAERASQHRLAQATEAIHEMTLVSCQLDTMRAALADHESKLTALTLAKGWK